MTSNRKKNGHISVEQMTEGPDLSGPVQLADGSIVDSAKIHPTRLLAIRLMQLKLTPRQREFMYQTAEAYPVSWTVHVPEMKLIKKGDWESCAINICHEDWRIGKGLEKKGLGYCIADHERKKHTMFVPSQLGALWMATFAADRAHNDSSAYQSDDGRSDVEFEAPFPAIITQASQPAKQAA